MAAADYSTPVDLLLAYGKGKVTHNPDEWPDYIVEVGLGPENIPDLIRMATDEDIADDDEGDLWVWGPVHAWRALGQMRAEAAIKPLLALLDWDDDWVSEEIPEVYGLIGPAALPALAGYLAGDHQESALTRAASGIKAIGLRHPDARDAAVAALLRQLEMFTDNGPWVNGFLVSDLVDLKAVEAAPIIGQAFAAHTVDEMIMGDWEEVQFELGLTTTPPQRAPGSKPFMPGFGPFAALANGTMRVPTHKAKPAKKSELRAAKEARRKNRKHK